MYSIANITDVESIMKNNTAEIIDFEQVRLRRAAARQPAMEWPIMPTMLIWVPVWCYVPQPQMQAVSQAI